MSVTDGGSGAREGYDVVMFRSLNALMRKLFRVKLSMSATEIWLPIHEGD